jgi:uncharacterized integral membrane protein
MSRLPRLLLLPLLSPLVVAILVGTLNPRPRVTLQLLTWRSPSLPLGVWMITAATGGAALSATATALALGQAAHLRRRSGVGGSFAGTPFRTHWPEEEGANRSRQRPGAGQDRAPAPAEVAWSAGPSRAPGEPAPTVEVPFRVLRRGGGEAVGPRAEAPRAEVPQRQSVPVAAEDDWAVDGGDDW